MALLPPKAKEKLGKPWRGPFLIVQKITDVTYKVQASKAAKPQVVHVDSLKPYKGISAPESWLHINMTSDSHPVVQDNSSVCPEVQDPSEDISVAQDDISEHPVVPSCIGSGPARQDIGHESLGRGHRLRKPPDRLDL